jgi:cytochrome c peroxidase
MRGMKRRIQHGIRLGLVLMFGILVLAGSGDSQGALNISPSLGLPPLISPPDNPTTAAKITLGRKLFFDKRLSLDNSISCATCHDPGYGFSDPHPVSVGVKGREGERNSHTLLNTAFMTPLMWDGRAATLEEQSLLPFLSHNEFDLPPEQAVIKLRRHGYSDLFKQAFGEDITVGNMAKALAAYQRSLMAGDSPFDRHLFRKDTNAISIEARRGFDVFLQANCDACHIIMTPGLHPFGLKHVIFTDGKFHNLGVGADKANQDAGRYDVTGEKEDWGRFRTPTLRNVALTAPYFHDGSAATLADVVKFYDEGGKPNRNLDPAIKPLKLSDQQKQDLVRFLESLTSSRTELLREAELADKE